MSYNGSGTFVINSTGQPVVTGTVISSSTFNAFTADIGTGLSTAITKNGQTTTTALIPFAFGISAAVSSSFAAGTVAAPSIYLATDTGTGFYRIGANNNGYSVSGTKLLDFSSALLAITGAATVSTTLGVTGATTLSSALTYGGVTLSNAVTGTGNMVLSASPTLTGTVSGATINASVGFNGILGGTTPAAASVTTLTASGIGSFTSGNGAVTLTPANTASSARTNIYWAAKNSTGDVRSTYFGSNMTFADGSTELDAQVTLNLMINGVVKTALTSTGASITGTLGVTGAITTATTALSGYKWDSWNPSDVTGTVTNAPSTGTSDDSAFTSAANSSGTLTLTFDVAGRYFVALTGQTAQAITFTFDRMTFNLGGTATRRSFTNSPSMAGNSANSSNFSITTSFIVIATAGQTLTVLPTYELTGAGTTGQHIAYASATATYLGG